MQAEVLARAQVRAAVVEPVLAVEWARALVEVAAQAWVGAQAELGLPLFVAQ